MKKAIKIILGIILIPVILIALLIGYLFLQDARERAQADKVEMVVKYDTKACSEDFPLAVVIRNNSDRTVNSIDFDITIRRKGYSKDLSDWMIDYESDKIIKPGDAHGSCWRYKLRSEYERYNNPKNLEFEIGYKSVRFSN